MDIIVGHEKLGKSLILYYKHHSISVDLKLLKKCEKILSKQLLIYYRDEYNSITEDVYYIYFIMYVEERQVR